MLLGLLTALSYSDLVKSWRGECGGRGIVGNHVGHSSGVYVHVIMYTTQGHCVGVKPLYIV